MLIRYFLHSLYIYQVELFKSGPQLTNLFIYLLNYVYQYRHMDMIISIILNICSDCSSFASWGFFQVGVCALWTCPVPFWSVSYVCHLISSRFINQSWNQPLSPALFCWRTVFRTQDLGARYAHWPCGATAFSPFPFNSKLGNVCLYTHSCINIHLDLFCLSSSAPSSIYIYLSVKNPWIHTDASNSSRIAERWF